MAQVYVGGRQFKDTAALVTRRATCEDAAVAIAAAGTTRLETGAARDETHSRAAAWFWKSAIAVIIWSVSYLLRQPGVAAAATAEPFSFVGNFALEGMVLALAWLGLLAAACLAVLTGAAQLEDPSAR